jgi:hypothetical protein
MILKIFGDLFVDRNGDVVPLQRLQSRGKICALVRKNFFPRQGGKNELKIEK